MANDHEDLLRQQQEQATREAAEGKKDKELADPNAEVPGDEVDTIVASTVATTEQTLMNGPAAARNTAVEHLGGDQAQVATVRAGFRQRAADIKDWLLKKTQRAETAVVGTPDTGDYVAELTPKEAANDVDHTVDGVRPPERTSSGDPIKDEVIAVIRRDPTEFDQLTNTERRPENVTEAERMQAALMYELYQLAGYVPGLREVRDQAIPDFTTAKKQMNEGLPSTDPEAALGTMTYPDLFTADQLVDAMEQAASQQRSESTQLFGASFDDWVNKGVGATLKTKGEALGEQVKKIDQRTEAWNTFTSAGLNQVWRLGKFAATMPIKGTYQFVKTSLVLGARSGSAAMEGLRRRRLNEDNADPAVVRTDTILSRGGDTLRKIERIMDIQRKLHGLRIDRQDLQNRGKLAEQPVDSESVDHLITKQLWREVCDEAERQNKAAALERLMGDERSLDQMFVEDPETGDLRLDDQELSVTFPRAHREQVTKRMETVSRNRTAIRDVCRRYVGADLKQRGNKLTQPGLQALNLGQFLFDMQADGSIDVELLIKPMARKRSEYDEGPSADQQDTFSMHLTVPADVTERLLAEAQAGNTAAKTNVFDDEAMARIFEDGIVEPTPDPELGQTQQTEQALATLKKLADETNTAAAQFALDPSDVKATALQELYGRLHKEYQPDQLGMEVNLPDAAQQTAFNSFVMNVAKAKDMVQAVLAAKKVNEPERPAKLTEAIKALRDFQQARQQEFASWHPAVTSERANQIQTKFSELVAQAGERANRYPVDSTVTLPKKFHQAKEPTTWTVAAAEHGVYRLERDGQHMLIQENDLANWVALASKEAKGPTQKTTRPKLRVAA